MRPIRGFRRHRTWTRVGLAFISALLAAAAIFILITGRKDLGRGDQLASVVSGVIGIASLLLTLHTLRPRKVDSETEFLQLWEQVKSHWNGNAQRWDLRNPRPLRLRWKRTARPVAVEVGPLAGVASEVAPPDLDGALIRDINDKRQPGITLVETFFEKNLQQMVVIGEPGSGKTTLALFFTLGALASDRADGPIPIILSLKTRRRGEALESWIAHRLQVDYLSTMSEESAIGLMASGRILPVLDGLDEVHINLRKETLDEINAAAGRGLRAIVTCRIQEYESVVKDAGVLTNADVIELVPVDLEDAIVFLQQPESAGSRRWNNVFARIRANPNGRLGQALTSPLTLSLARQVFSRPASSPGDLLESDAARDPSSFLLRRFIPSRYPTEEAAARATRSLAFLQQGLKLEGGDQGSAMAWWNLAQAMPRWVTQWLLPALTVLTMTLLGLADAWSLHRLLALQVSSIDEVLAAGAVLGAAVGVMIARRDIRLSTHARLEEPAAVSLGQLIRHIAADVLAGVATLSGSFAVVLVVARLSGRFDLVAMYGIVNAAQAVLSGDLRLPVLATVILCGALVVAIITNGLVYRRSGKPRRTRPGVRQLLTSIGLAALAGIGVSVLFGAVFMLVGLDEDFDPRVGIILAIGLSLFLSTALGLGRWLAGTDDAHQHSVSPDSVLSGDRAALLITMVCSLIVGTGVALLAIAQTTIGSRQTLWLSPLVGVNLATLVSLGVGSAWLLFVTARLYFWLRRLTPLRLMKFLRDATANDILRQTGPTYVVRHAKLATVIAENGRAWESVWSAAPSAQRSGAARRVSLGLVVLALVAFPVAVVLVPEPDKADVKPTALPLLVSHPTFSRDGRYLATTTSDGDRVDIWRTDTHHQIFHIEDVRHVTRLVFADDGATVTTAEPGPHGDADEWVKIWSLATGSLLASLSGSHGWYNATYSPDQRWLVTVDVNGKVLLWSAATGRFVKNLSMGGQVADKIRFSGRGDRIVVANRSGRVRIWNTASWNAVATFDHPETTFTDVALSPDGKILAVADGAGSVRLTSVDNRSDLGVLPGTHLALEFSTDGRTLAAAGIEVTVHLWDVAAQRIGASLRGLTSPAFDLAYTPDGSRLIAGGADGKAVVWDTRSGDAIRLSDPAFDALEGRLAKPYPISHVAISPDSTHVVTVDSYHRLRIWDLSTGITTRVVTLPVSSLEFRPDNVTVTGNGPNGTRWTANIMRNDAITEREPIARQVLSDPLGATVAALTIDGRIRIYDLSSGAVRAEGQERYARTELTPDGRFMATVSEYGSVRLWSMRDGSSSHILVRGDTDAPFTSIRQLAGMDRVVIGGPNGIEVWSSTSGQLLRTIPNTSTYVSLSGDGRSFATIDKDRKAHVWRTSTASEESTLQVRASPLGIQTGCRLVAVSPDASIVATINSDHSIRLWERRSGRLTRTISSLRADTKDAFFLPYRNLLVVLTADGSVQFFEL